MENQTSSERNLVDDIDWNAMSEEEFAENIFARADDEGPVLTPDDMDKIEECWGMRRAARRCSLVTLTKPFKEISEGVEKDREFALAVAEVLSCNNNLDFYKGMNRLLEQANVWGSLALTCREDMQEILAEVEDYT